MAEGRQGDLAQDSQQVEADDNGCAVCTDGEVHRAVQEVPERTEQYCSDGESPDTGLMHMNRKDRKRLSQATKKALCRVKECLTCNTEDLKGTCDAIARVSEADVFHVHLSQRHSDDEVSEVFSMPRIVPMAEKKGLRGGRSFDLGNGWDFLRADHRKQCIETLKESKSFAVVVSPPCVEYSNIQNLNRGNNEGDRRKKIEAQTLLDFAMQICRQQNKSGNLFVFEHPAFASSWLSDSVHDVSQLPGACDVVLDQCMFGLKDPCSHKHYKKATRFLTNSKHVAEGMNRRCNGQHEHQQLQGQVKVAGKWCNRTRIAQVYPKELVSCLLSCIRRARRARESEVLAAEELRVEDQKKLEESVRRCHINLGHPSRERFLHMLKSANAGEQAIKVAKRLRCSTCEANRAPASHNVAKHKRAEVFNEQIMMDTFDLPLKDGKKVSMLNICDEGTGMQICVPLRKGKQTEHVRSAYRKNWKRWAGVPKRVLTDGGGEFDGVVQEGFEIDGSYVEKTAAYAPWQNGVCERHGGIWKDAFGKAYEETQPTSKRELHELMDQINHARNSMCRKHGYAPYQHVFGCDLRLPGLVTDPLNVVHSSAVVHGVDSVLATQRLRQAARRAFVDMDNEDKVRRALEHRSRPQRGPFLPGDHVYFWRKMPRESNRGRWRGPGLVIGSADSNSKAWVACGNKVLRCCPEQLRRATEDQEAALRFVPAEIVAQRREARGAQVFVDISQAHLPPPEASEPDRTEEENKKRNRQQAGLEEDTPAEMETIDMNVAGEEVATEPTMEPAQSEVTLGGTTSRQVTEETGQMGAYGPMRDASLQVTRTTEPYPETELGKALRQSVEILDSGRIRLPRGELARNEDVPRRSTFAENTPLPENDDEVLEVFYSINDEDIWRLTMCRRTAQRCTSRT